MTDFRPVESPRTGAGRPHQPHAASEAAPPNSRDSGAGRKQWLLIVVFSVGLFLGGVALARLLAHGHNPSTATALTPALSGGGGLPVGLAGAPDQSTPTTGTNPNAGASQSTGAAGSAGSAPGSATSSLSAVGEAASLSITEPQANEGTTTSGSSPATSTPAGSTAPNSGTPDISTIEPAQTSPAETSSTFSTAPAQASMSERTTAPSPQLTAPSPTTSTTPP